MHQMWHMGISMTTSFVKLEARLLEATELVRRLKECIETLDGLMGPPLPRTSVVIAAAEAFLASLAKKEA